MRFLIDQVILVAQIDEEAFKELSDNAYEALERKHKLRDDPLVSLKEEYLMDIPYKFEDWLAKTIDRTFLLHKEKRGVYGADHTNLKMKGLWVNRMHKGDQHFPHQHDSSFYSFSAYVKTTDNDAPFMFIHNDMGQPVNMDENSMGHVLIFPSTLIHTVYPKTTDGERISVSGNVILET